MNNKQRQQLNKIADNIDNIIVELSSILSEEEEKYDNLSEGLQNTKRGEDIENAINVLDECIDDLDEIVDAIINL